MGVGRADDAEAERVEALGLLEHEAVYVGLPDVAALGFAVEIGGDAVGEDLEVGPLVVRRQQRVGLRSALDLGHLDQGLVAHPQVGVGGVKRFAAHRLQLEHVAVAAVRVVGDGEPFDALRPAFVEPAPEVLGIARIGRRKGLRRRFAAAEDDVAVQVAAIVRRGRVLVADESGEVPRVVVGLGGVDDRLPGGGFGVVLRVLRQLGELAAAEPLDGARETAPFAQIGPEFGRVEGILGVVHLREHAEVQAVVGYRLEVEGAALQLELVAAGVFDRLALGEPVGVVGVRARAEQVRIEGVLGVHVEVAEVGVLQRVRRRGVAAAGSARAGFLVAGSAAEQNEREKGQEGEDRASRAHDDLLGGIVRRLARTARAMGHRAPAPRTRERRRVR